MTRFEVTYAPEGFLVRERVVFRLVEDEAATPRHGLLRKRGYATVETVRRIADAPGVPDAAVGYCGLKDENGPPSS